MCYGQRDGVPVSSTFMFYLWLQRLALYFVVVRPFIPHIKQKMSTRKSVKIWNEFIAKRLCDLLKNLQINDYVIF